MSDKTVMIITGESSGELYGSLLARALKASHPDMKIAGVGGQKMREAGVELISGIAGAFGLIEAISALSAVKETLRKTIAAMKELNPSVVVCIDYPDFNFRVASAAQALGIKVLYYVSPQIWAWRKGRIKTLARIADRMCVVLPFEEEIYKDSGLRCEFVGHPVMDEMATLPTSKAEAKTALGIPLDVPVFSLLPGSRGSELSYLMPLFLQVARRLRADYPGYRLLLPLAPNLSADRYKDVLGMFEGEGVTVLNDVNAVVALAASEGAVIASGTATLQATLLETPMVVVYRLFPLTYLIAKMILHVKYITITNLILGKSAIVELIQGRANEGEVVAEVHKMLDDTQYRTRLLADLHSVHDIYADKTPSARVAAIIGEMAGW